MPRWHPSGKGAPRLDRNPDYVFDVLRDGAKRARVIAQQTMAEVREAIGLF